MKYIVSGVAVLVTIFLAVALYIQQQEVGKLRHQLAAVHTQQQADISHLGDLSNQIQNVSNTVSNFTQPSDPLSAYNQVCNNTLTNGNTGVDQIYYFPCTNNIIPAAG